MNPLALTLENTYTLLLYVGKGKTYPLSLSLLNPRRSPLTPPTPMTTCGPGFLRTLSPSLLLPKAP